MNRLQELTFSAVVTERKVQLGSLKRPAVILVVDQHNFQAAVDFNPGIRMLVPDFEKLWVINVVALQSVPRLFRRLANHYLHLAFDTGAAALPDGFDPRDYVVILPDWNGDVFASLAINNKIGDPILIVLDSSGEVVSTQIGDDPLAAAQEILLREKLIAD